MKNKSYGTAILATSFMIVGFTLGVVFGIAITAIQDDGYLCVYYHLKDGTELRETIYIDEIIEIESILINDNSCYQRIWFCIKADGSIEYRDLYKAYAITYKRKE